MLVPSVVLPQRHAVIALPASVAAAAVVPISGTRVTTLVSMVGSLKPWAVAVILPATDVSTLVTYLLPEPVEISQPQPFAAGMLAELEALW